MTKKWFEKLKGIRLQMPWGHTSVEKKKSPALEGATGHDEIPDLAASNRELVLILVLQPLLSKPF